MPSNLSSFSPESPIDRPCIRVVLADDHPIVRDALKGLLRLEEDIEVVGEASDGEELLRILPQVTPDIVVLDLRMPKLDGLAALRAFRDVSPGPKVIILTASEDKNEIVEAMRLGCSAVVQKHSVSDLIVRSIRKVHKGGLAGGSNIPAAVAQQFSGKAENRGFDVAGHSTLSNRETQIVKLVALGYKNRDIAQKLYITEQTVKNHLHNIYDKLAISDRLELALYAIQRGLHLSD